MYFGYGRILIENDITDYIVRAIIEMTRTWRRLIPASTRWVATLCLRVKLISGMRCDSFIPSIRNSEKG
jgi:hypothetical protein